MTLAGATLAQPPQARLSRSLLPILSDAAGRDARRGRDRLERRIEAAFAALHLPHGDAAEVEPENTGDVGIRQFVFTLGGLDRVATCVTGRAGATPHIHLVWGLGRQVPVVELATDHVPESRAVHVAAELTALRLRPGEEDGEAAPLAFAGLGGCFAVLVHSFFDFTLHTTANALLFLVLAALATMNGYVEDAPRRRRRKTSAEAQT